MICCALIPLHVRELLGLVQSLSHGMEALSRACLVQFWWLLDHDSRPAAGPSLPQIELDRNAFRTFIDDCLMTVVGLECFLIASFRIPRGTCSLLQ